MKTVLRIFAFLLIPTLSTFAQPILNHSNMVPSAGSNFTYHQFLSFEPGESGIDAQWDFSNLGPTDAYTINYIAAETSPHAEVFGNADIALRF